MHICDSGSLPSFYTLLPKGKNCFLGRFASSNKPLNSLTLKLMAAATGVIVLSDYFFLSLSEHLAHLRHGFMGNSGQLRVLISQSMKDQIECKKHVLIACLFLTFLLHPSVSRYTNLSHDHSGSSKGNKHPVVKSLYPLIRFHQILSHTTF